MILQKDPRLKKEIQEFGCYYMVLLYYANKFKNFPLSTEIINRLYGRFVFRNWMTEYCRIENPEAILRDMGLFVKYHDRHDPPDYICKENEFEILHWVNKTNGQTEHFTAGNGAGIVTYDPYGCSNTVRYGKLTSKRIFTLLNGQVC